jgi:LemA protein
MLITLIALGFLLLISILTYNGLIAKINQIGNAEGSLAATLKQRFDLLPNLIEVAKQYMSHEEKMLTRIIELRSQGQAAHTSSDLIERSKDLDVELKKFMVTVESYPTLLSNNNFVKIQDALIDLENNISASRRFYNTSIVAYNESIQMIPGVFMAQFLGMRSREIYSIAENEKETPDMKELFKK